MAEPQPTMIELKPGYQVYKKEQIDDLVKQLENLRAKSHTQTVLILQSIKVVESVKKAFPGLANGNGFASFNISSILSGDVLTTLQPDFEKLTKLITEYTKQNPIPKQ